VRSLRCGLLLVAIVPHNLAFMKQLTIDELHELRLVIFDNADSLYKEAKVLFDAGFHARAYLLAYFACEELGKLPIIVGVVGNRITSLRGSAT
jgi:hypothetical protein